MLSQPGWKNPDTIGFFFGAGASIEFGIPSMKQMTTSFATKIGEDASLSKEGEVFDEIYDSLAKVYGKDGVDLEAIMSAIVGLQESDHIRDGAQELPCRAVKVLHVHAGSRRGIHDVPTTNALRGNAVQILQGNNECTAETSAA